MLPNAESQDGEGTESQADNAGAGDEVMVVQQRVGQAANKAEPDTGASSTTGEGGPESADASSASTVETVGVGITSGEDTPELHAKTLAGPPKKRACGTVTMELLRTKSVLVILLQVDLKENLYFFFFSLFVHLFAVV